MIFLLYINSFLIKRRKSEFGLYNILGMEKKHICRVIFLETVFTFLIMLVFLLVRPRGIAGSNIQEKA